MCQMSLFSELLQHKQKYKSALTNALSILTPRMNNPVCSVERIYTKFSDFASKICVFMYAPISQPVLPCITHCTFLIWMS